MLVFVQKNMITCMCISAATVILMICGILFFPQIKIGKISISSYWIITLAGAAVLLIFGGADLAAVGRSLVQDTAVNPVKILVLFICMTVLSVYLDELGFFRYLACVALERAKSGQKSMFIILYVTVSVLTVFTSNDVIILSFTPFVCYFAKHAKIDPLPYLAAEFVAANTWSLALLIGNPTNIYLATAYNIDFAAYVEISVLPTLFAGGVSFACLYLLFRKKLAQPMAKAEERVELDDKFLLGVGVAHLAVCTVLLAVSSYVKWEMWLVALCSVASLFVISAVTYAVRRKAPTHLLCCIKRAPWQLVPFMLSMFVMIAVLEQKGATAQLAALIGNDLPILKYGVLSFISANVINNIPMSVLFASIAEEAQGGLAAVFATIIGSNVGAYLTPVGALAGIMWTSIVHRQGIKFGYVDFIKMGLVTAVPALFAALGGLYLSLALIG